MAVKVKSLLYNGIHTNISCDLLNRIIESSPDLSQLITITSAPELLQKIQFKNISHFEVDYHKAMSGVYPQETLEPLDQEILDQLAPYWFVAFKMMDRHSPETIYSYQTRVDMLLEHVKYWETILTQNKVDCFISNNYPHEVYDYIIYALCKSKGIKTLFFDQIQIEGHIQLLDSVEENTPKFLSTVDGPAYQPLSPTFESHWQKKVEAKPPFYMAINQRVADREKKILFLLKKYILKLQSIFNRLIRKRPPGFKTIIKILYFKSLFGPSAEKKLSKLYEQLSISPNFDEEFIYVPLHFQPECTTSPQGGYFVFQELMIELLSKTVPPHVAIYVKEHPFQKIHGRTESFYKKISTMKNVRLINRKAPSHTLIQKSFAVATVTGTAGWEALFLNKRTLLFGSAFYQHAPGVFRVRTKQECKKALQNIYEQKDVEFGNELRKFMSQMDQYLVRGWIDPPYEKIANINYQENLDNLINALVKRLTN